MKSFTGYRWWEQKNPAYRKSCFRQAARETTIHAYERDAIIEFLNKYDKSV